MNTDSRLAGLPSAPMATSASSASGEAPSIAGASISGKLFKVKRCISRVDMMLPQMAPNRPTSAADILPYDIIIRITISPIPNEVPKFVRLTSWYFLKYPANLRSLLRAMMAGLSERKVITAPMAATPGRRYSGFISGRSSFSSSCTTPNSLSSLPSAPARTVMPIRKKTVLSSRSWAVAMMVFIRFLPPMKWPSTPNPTPITASRIRASTMYR